MPTGAATKRTGHPGVRAAKVKRVRAARRPMSSTDASRFVRRAPARPLVWLGDRPDRAVEPFLGERFGAYQVKERDFVLDLPSARTRRRLEP